MSTSDEPVTQVEPLLPVSLGEVVLGKYRIERILGSGGMGVVAQATHLALRERVALKFLLPGAQRDESALRRFEREAQAAVRLKGEHVARVLDVGALEDGSPFLVMELLEGRDVAEVLATEGPLPVARAVDYVLDACEAIAEAHALGVVHRDLKPKNLFLAERPNGRSLVKVLDFGISKVTDAEADGAFALTRTTEVIGSPSYMPPEQLRSLRDADARSDIWALGVILYELLAGRVPFEAQTVTELCAKVFQDEAAPLHTKRPDVPEALWHVVERCLRKVRDERFASVTELAQALAPFGSGTSGGPAWALAAPAMSLRLEPKPRRPWLMAALGVAGLGCMAGVAWMALAKAPPPERPPTPASAVAPEPTPAPAASVAAQGPALPAASGEPPAPVIEPGGPASAATRPKPAPARSTRPSQAAPPPDDELPTTRH